MSFLKRFFKAEPEVLPVPEKLEGDALWQKYCDDSRKFIQQKRYVSYWSTRLSMADFRRKEKAYRSALFLLTEAICWDVNECADDQLEDSIRNMEITGEFLFPKKAADFIIAPAIMLNIERCRKGLGYTDDTLRSAMQEAISSISLPRWLYTKDETIDLFFCYKNQTKGIMTIVNRAKRRMKEKYPGIKF